MKKRKKIWIRIGIIVASVMCILLCFNVYSLYIEAEKAQKTAFTGNILTIGQDIVDKINSELANKENVQKTIASDSAVALTKETFLFDKQPVALIKETTIDYNGTTVILRKDTTYMSPQDTLTTDSLLSVPVLSADDSVEISEFSNLIINTINKTTLREYIANKLSENKLNVEFDFGIYNLPENTYVLAPKIRDPEMLKNGYVFALTHNQERSHSHYFILYFPSVRTYFLQRMSTIVLPIFFLLLSIMFLFILLFISFNQQKINEEVKNNFINNMTHEFKTPISTISLACGYCSLKIEIACFRRSCISATTAPWKAAHISFLSCSERVF